MGVAEGLGGRPIQRRGKQNAARYTSIGHVAVIGVALLVIGGKKTNQYAPPPSQKVSVAKPLGQKFTRCLEATDSTAAVAPVDLMVRVQGVVPCFFVAMQGFGKWPARLKAPAANLVV
jgi:hypothetical protein